MMMLKCLTFMKKKYREDDKGEAIRALHGVAKGMNDKDSVMEFVKVMLTESEQLVIGRRVLLAQMLLTGHSQSDIKDKLHISPNNLIRTRRWLEKQIPNYKELISSINDTQEKKQTSFGYMNPLSFKGLRRKKAGHFLLANISKDLIKN